MIALGLFIVFLVFWLVSILPMPGPNPAAPAANIFAWLSVFMLGIISHAIHL